MKRYFKIQSLTLFVCLFLHLEIFDVSSSTRDGFLPPQLGDLINLTTLWLSNNEFSGTILGSLGNLDNLTLLGVFENNLSGLIEQNQKK